MRCCCLFGNRQPPPHPKQNHLQYTVPLISEAYRNHPPKSTCSFAEMFLWFFVSSAFFLSHFSHPPNNSLLILHLCTQFSDGNRRTCTHTVRVAGWMAVQCLQLLLGDKSLVSFQLIFQHSRTAAFNSKSKYTDCMMAVILIRDS